MTHVKSLVAMSIEKMLLKTSGAAFLKGIAFMYSAGLSPDRITVMQTASGKYILQFHSRCDIRPFAANYPEFRRLLRGIVHIKAWRLKSIEFTNVGFKIEDAQLIETAIDKLGVELVLLNNCTYPGVEKGDQAMRLFTAFNRKRSTIVCEYGDERLKTLINSYRPPAPARAARRAPVAAGPLPPPVPLAALPLMAQAVHVPLPQHPVQQPAAAFPVLAAPPVPRDVAPVVPSDDEPEIDQQGMDEGDAAAPLADSASDRSSDRDSEEDMEVDVEAGPSGGRPRCASHSRRTPHGPGLRAAVRKLDLHRNDSS